MDIQPLKLIDVSASAGASCSGPDCGCAVDAAAVDGIVSVPGSAPVVQEFAVEGMTCGHCVSAVTKQVAGVPGVESVDIDLVPGGRSTVAVGSDRPIDPDAVRAAVEEAGYVLAN